MTVDQLLRDEIDGAVTEAIQKIESDRKPPEAGEESRAAAEPKEDLPPDKGQDGGEKAQEGETSGDDGKKKDEKKTDDAGKEPEVSDILVERAIKAGMSISDARSFKKAEALERVCGVLEKKRESSGGDSAGDKKDGDKKGDEDPLAAIPDLDPKDLDPEEYDEKVIAVVGAVKALKAFVRKQQETIGGLLREGKSRDSSWFDGQVASLGEVFAEVVGDGNRAKMDPGSPQAKKLADLESKFNVLSAGYKAAGQEVSREAAFNEAVSIVLGDVKAKSEATLKAGKLDDRKRQHVARPSGASVKPTTDPLADVAGELDRKYFGKK